MSRIGKNPVQVLDGVTVEIDGQQVSAKGPKGTLTRYVHDSVSVTQEDGEDGKIIRLAPNSDDKKAISLWPTWRTQINNLVVGVKDGFTKKLEIQGVGYRAQMQGQDLVLQLGYSHEIKYPVPQDINISVDKQTLIEISGVDKEQVGQIAAEIYAMRPPEPYKGKGVRYQGQQIFRKEGKKK